MYESNATITHSIATCNSHNKKENDRRKAVLLVRLYLFGAALWKNYVENR